MADSSPSPAPPELSERQVQRATLLLKVASSGRADAVELITRLIQEGAPVNCTDASGYSALALAVRVGDTRSCRALLENVASPAVATREKANPPLFWGAAVDHVEAIQLLLDAAADPFQCNVQGDTALMWACR